MTVERPLEAAMANTDFPSSSMAFTSAPARKSRSTMSSKLAG